MITRQRLVTFGIPTLAIATITTAALLHQRDVGPEPVVVRPSESSGDGHDIDVVFAVDTTGSMGRLLDGAKRTVWSIASHIRKTDPNANLRIGLVAYRDVGDEYVTKPFALTTDLDAVYGELASYRASGGGDTPENVDAALDQMLRMQWRAGATKLVFVVGDAPPSTRGDVKPYDELAREAASRGITINAIRCGDDAQTAIAFEALARQGKGEFSTIEQSGGVQQVATPYDAEIAALSSEYDGTAVIVGGDDARARYEGKMAVTAAAPAAAKADRAEYYARKGGGRDADDLVSGYATGTVDVGAVAPTALPEELRNKDKAELKAELEARVAKRKALDEKMSNLAKKRADYLEEATKNGEGGPGGFDRTVKSTVEKQLKK